jgi:TetR/AcrR family transcriptional regulator, cholesterol catabolism regulator
MEVLNKKSEIRDPETRTRILTAADELFMRYGFKAITMDEIAKHVGVSKKTIYQHFEDKDEIVCQVMQEHFEKDRICTATFREQAENPVHELVLDMTNFRQVMNNIHPSAAFEIKKYHPAAWKIFDEHKKNWILQSIIDNLKAGIKQGYYRPGINPEILARMRVETVGVAFDPGVFPPSLFSFSDIQMQCMEHFIHGILTDKGREFFNRYLPNPS